MKHTLGGLCFAVALAFAAGLYLGMAKVAWDANSKANGFIVFFGFGIPMLLAGAGTFALWSDSKLMVQRFGWACTVAGLLWAASLFYLLAGWVGIVSSDMKAGFAECVGLFLGFGIPMLVCGGAGIGVLVEPPQGAA
jgi:hypothetical protein